MGEYEDKEDTALVRDLGSADREARNEIWAEIIRRYGEMILQYLVKKFGKSIGLEDILQETLMAALESIDSFDPRMAKLSTWLIGIARNKALDERKKRRAIKRGGEETTHSLTAVSDDGEDFSLEPLSRDNSADRVAKHEWYQIITKEITRMSPLRRDITHNLIHCVNDEWEGEIENDEELAYRHDTTIANVRVQRSHIKSQLQEALQGVLFDSSRKL